MQIKVDTADELLTKALSKLTIIEEEQLKLCEKIDNNWDELIKIINEKTRIRGSPRAAVTHQHAGYQLPNFGAAAAIDRCVF